MIPLKVFNKTLEISKIINDRLIENIKIWFYYIRGWNS